MPDTKPIAPFAAGTQCWSMAASGRGGTVVIAAIVGSGYWFDEVYMVAIGRHHLDWGSADQPPLTPADAALIDTFLPDSIVALRIPAIAATAGCVVVAGLIARELGCDRRAQMLVAAAQAMTLWINLAGHWLTPYALEPVEWLLLLWLLVRWIRTRDDHLLLILGVVVGVAAMTKFQVLLLCAVLLVAVAAFGPRSLLRRQAFWAGSGIAVVIACPDAGLAGNARLASAEDGIDRGRGGGSAVRRTSRHCRDADRVRRSGDDDARRIRHLALAPDRGVA